MTRRQLNTICLTLVTVLLCFVTIGYSALQKTLTISGDVTILKPRDPVLLSTSYFDDYAFRDYEYKDKIKIINFSDQISPPSGYTASWDVGESQTGNVMAYIKPNSSDSNYYDLYIQGDGHLYANEDSHLCFMK